MNRDLVTSALEHVDTEPSNDFLSELRTRLIVELTDSHESSSSAEMPSPPPPPQEYVMLAPAPLRVTARPRPLKILLAAAACLAVFALAAVIANRPNSDLPANGELNDVDMAEATALGQAALVRPEDLGSRFYRYAEPIPEFIWAEQAAATAAAHPDCAVLPSLGLAPPTTKAAFSRQWLHGGGAITGQSIVVFATAADASRAMDMIASNGYQACDIDLFDRLTPFAPEADGTSVTEPWQAPTIAPHGDRQVINGQHTTYSTSSGTYDEYRISAYLQVGRAIMWINPRYVTTAAQPLFLPEKMISASAAALQSVVGK